MSTRGGPSSLPSITVRPSPAEKARFASIAAAKGMTESALALSAIRAYLGPGAAAPHSPSPSPRIGSTDRITIRLRPGDGRWIARRAEQRGMKSSAYVAALVRAHISRSPPLPDEDLRVLKRTVVFLGTLGRVIGNQTPTELSRDDLQQTRASIAELQQRVHDFAKASLVAWESRID